MQQHEAVFQTYRNARQRAFLRLNDLRLSVDQWLEAHVSGPITLMDLTELEALNSRRTTVIEELQRSEAVLMELLIREAQGQESPTPRAIEPTAQCDAIQSEGR